MGVAKPEAVTIQTNAFPTYDDSDNPTNCCPRFNPEGWDHQDLHFEDKLFVRAETKSIMHVPLNMGKVFTQTFDAIKNADALDMKQCIVLSRDTSPWKSEHYFTVNKSVPGMEMDRLSGDFHTMVFEGPYSETKHYHEQLIESVGGDKHNPPDTYFFYTTCPKCVKVYGKNYMVGFVKIEN